MPTVETDGTTIQYETEGDPERPTVVFVSGTATGPWLWGWQAPTLAGAHHTVVYAQRGTDGSDTDGPYTVDRLAADLEAVLADADVRRAHVVGAGLGGMVALRYAREYSRARSLTLFGVAPTGDAIDADALAGLHPSDPTRIRQSLSLAFSDRFLAETGLTDDIVKWRKDEDAVGDARGGHIDAALGFESGPLYEVDLPTLVFHGVDDPVVPPSVGEDLATDLPRGRFEPVEGKRWCFIEHSAAVTDVIAEFIEESDATDD
ncbi:alpha/beta fold hydrolase [Natronomonas sp.]|uniref:alpha/beta fold hydrolase n=1 Tax=Natronomonas sp. TaxID=2184060 RepID=UPI002FC30B27